jgi:hypothetical protein
MTLLPAFWPLVAVYCCGTVRFPGERGVLFLGGVYSDSPVWCGLGDLLSQPLENGGFGFGANVTSVIFSTIIVVLVGGLSLVEYRKPTQKR